jgi:hypothetical protein
VALNTEDAKENIMPCIKYKSDVEQFIAWPWNGKMSMKGMCICSIPG